MSNRSVPTYPRQARLAAGLGDRLRAARLRRRLSATEMAERVGVSRSTVARLEAGDPRVALGVMVRYLGVLGVDDDLSRILEADEIGMRIADASATVKRRRAGTR
jgi:transcriptional regulator with XRE-family HTH domain